MDFFGRASPGFQFGSANRVGPGSEVAIGTLKSEVRTSPVMYQSNPKSVLVQIISV